MAGYTVEQIRNVILLSHSGAGKTTMGEAMLFTCGAIPRIGRVEEGNTTSDFDPEEIKRRMSLNLTLLPCPWKGNRVNLLDTPGYADFVGEVRAGLRVTEAAIILVSAAAGIEVGTELVWRYSQEAGLPRFIMVNKLDRENTDFYRSVEAIRSQFGPRCIPIQVPLGAEQGFQGVIELLSGKAYGHSGEEIASPTPPPQAAPWREKLVEAIAETDDALIARYLEGVEMSLEELQRGLRQGVLKGQIVPILAGSALKNIGIHQLLETIVSYLPSPREAPTVSATKPQTKETIPIVADPNGPLAALVFKTTADPYVGKLTYFRVYSGTMSANSQVWNPSRGNVERIGQLYTLRGKFQEAVSQLIAGDIGAVAKLTVSATGDTFSSRENPLLFAPITFPAPCLSLAIQPKTKADLDKMGSALPRITEEDPTLQVRKDADTGEILLVGQGETHIEVTAERLQRKFGVEVKLDIPKVPYKETITVASDTDYRHKKQTGGHGQFAHVYMKFEPLPRGSGLEFVDNIVGGAIPRNYIPAVEKGFREAALEGGLAGYPVIDVRGILYDGKEHPVDSSDICFKIAGAGALKKGLAEGRPVLVEPVMKITITVPEGYTGDIMGDLNTKRARVLGMIPQGGGINAVEALVPLAEVRRYAIDLRAKTQGRGSFSLEFSHYEEVPAHVAQKIIAEKKG